MGGKRMARQVHDRDISATLEAASEWINRCLIEDGSMFAKNLWRLGVAREVQRAFDDHPDFGADDFMTKLRGQMKSASPTVQQLMAEMLWALLLFPSNMKARTKRQQVRDIWSLSGEQLGEANPYLAEDVLKGIGSGGPGFNNYRPDEMSFLIAIVVDLKGRNKDDRRRNLTDYEAFMSWIVTVPQKGNRQFRHMLRYFAFPDRVERMSSNNDRRKILEAFGEASSREAGNLSDRELDDRLMTLRTKLQATHPSPILDFYDPALKKRWAGERVVETPTGALSVTVPSDDDDAETAPVAAGQAQPVEPRQSIQMQAKLAVIGATIGLNVWIPRPDRSRVLELIPAALHVALLEKLPLSYDLTTLETIELIDVIWIRNRSIIRAFEVEHTTSVYSGLLRMADLLALQPNMNIRLHIVAPDERRDKVFKEMLRPVFTLLARGPLSNTCTFVSYESVDAISDLKHLSHTSETVFADFEERAEAEAL
jgi:hypothetical protein